MKLKPALLWVTLLATIVSLIILLTRSNLRGLEMGGDFAQYWSAGRLNLLGENPYDLQRLAELQLPHEPAGGQALIMWLPPWVYPLVMPIGILPYTAARMVWFFGELILVFACANWLWAHYHGDKRWLWLLWSVTFLHWATLEALRSGQVSPFVLAGAVLFLALTSIGAMGWAGAALLFVLIKPHLLYLFSLAVFLWAVEQRRWRVLVGWGTALVAGVGIACLPNWRLFGQYIETARQRPPDQWITATIGGQLRLYWGAEHFWLQFVPVAFGLAWLAWYWQRQHRTWVWSQQLPILALVSLSTAAYGWRHDQTITLLAIWPAFAWLLTSRRPALHKIIFVGLYGLIDWLAIASTRPQDWFWWFPLAILAWYLAVQKIFYENDDQPLAAI
jgi:hypothetical protein